MAENGGNREAVAIGPKTRFGCSRCLAKCAAVLLVLIAVFVYWNLLRTPTLRISKETTHITEPLTADGTRVDYIGALEKEIYPPEMKTDDNGYRLIVRALGVAADEGQEDGSNVEARSAQVYGKLGLDRTIGPTMTLQDPWDYLMAYAERQGADEEKATEWADQTSDPWRLDDLPMMGAFLEENAPALEVLGKAVRKPVFRMPMVSDEAWPRLQIPSNEYHRMRGFARALSARSNFRVATGDIDGAIDDLIVCKRLGRRLQNQSTVIAYLVGLGVEGIADSIGIGAMAESPPAETQLERLVAELNGLPPRPGLGATLLTDRYSALDYLQAMAHGERSLADDLSIREMFGGPESGVVASLPVDWNIVLQRVNAEYDTLETTRTFQTLEFPLLGNLFIGARSRWVADHMAWMHGASGWAIREADRRSHCVENVSRIVVAMLIYERRHGTLPPAYTVDAHGNPLHSWRVLLLPYLGEEKLFGKLRLDEAWDSPHNRRFHDAVPTIYQCPSAELQPGQTTYSVVVGEKTAFKASKGKPLADFGVHLALVVERRWPVCWMDPTSELAESVAIEGINREEGDADEIYSPHPGGVNVGYRDGSTRYISETIEAPLWQGMLDGTAEEY